jgi:hypothetical protein
MDSYSCLPLLHAKIAKHPSNLDLFEQRLLKVTGSIRIGVSSSIHGFLFLVCRSLTSR